MRFFVFRASLPQHDKVFHLVLLKHDRVNHILNCHSERSEKAISA
jgi:hypothetical protein